MISIVSGPIRLKAFGLLLVASSLVLGACSNSAESPSADLETAASVAPPAINTPDVLSVCAALGLGAVPLFYFDENQEPKGIEVELAQAIAESLGLEYREVSTAFPSLIPSIEAGQCDAVMSSLFITDEREEVVDFVPYLESGSSLLTLASDETGITGFNDTLCGTKVSSPTGTSAVIVLAELSDNCEAGGKQPVTISEIDGAATGRLLVETRQVDSYAGSTADTLYLADQSAGELVVKGEPFEIRTIGAAVKKGNAELFDAIQGALADMKANGTYQEILDSVGLGELAHVG